MFTLCVRGMGVTCMSSLRRRRSTASRPDTARRKWWVVSLQSLALLLIGSLVIPWALGRANRVVDDRAKERAQKQAIVESLDSAVTGTVVLGDLYAAHLISATARGSSVAPGGAQYAETLKSWLVQGSTLIAEVSTTFDGATLRESTESLTNAVTDYLRIGAGVETTVNRQSAVADWQRVAERAGAVPRVAWNALLGSERNAAFYAAFHSVGYGVILHYRDVVEDEIMSGHAQGYLDGYFGS